MLYLLTEAQTFADKGLQYKNRAIAVSLIKFPPCDLNNSRQGEGDTIKPLLNVFDSFNIKAESEESSSVIVNGISADLVDSLELLFENESKSGGGKLKNIELDLNHARALITFQSSSGT